MTTFAGLEINGSIQYGSEPKDQRSQEEFTEILERALAVEGIGGFKWHQYTPYFNDGDPCVFSPSAYNYDEGDEEDTDDHYMEWFAFMEDGRRLNCGSLEDKDDNYPFGKLSHEYGEKPGGGWGRINEKYEGDRKEDALAINALAEAIEGGEFDVVLLKLFGDHAEVKVVKNDGIYVEFYNHD